MMNKHSLKSWFVAVRPWSFPASVMPILVTLAYLFWRGYEVDWLLGVWVLINMALFHAAGNTWSDYYDFKYGVDKEDTYGAVSITSGEFLPQEIRLLSFILLVISVGGGLALTYISGWPVLILGLLGFFLTVCYPWLKYSALGDVDIFLSFALLPMLGVSFVVTDIFVFDVLWIALPVGLITVGILHSNNMRDVLPDSRANIKTFAMVLGVKWSVYIYCFEVIFPFIWLIVCMLIGVLPMWSLISLIAMKMAIDNAKGALCFLSKGDVSFVAHHDEWTAKLQLVFSILLTVSLFIAALI